MDAPARYRLGIDAGSLTLKFVLLKDGVPVASGSRPHHGRPVETAAALINGSIPEPADPVMIGLTGSGVGPVAQRLGVEPLDLVACTIAGVGFHRSGIDTIIDIGGGSLTLIELEGATGRFRRFSRNSLCAAGTGSFLDEQAQRLGLAPEAVAGMPRLDDPPPVAARCAVFAKSDLIHRQQQGYPPEAVWSGLCRGMVMTAITTLFRGRPIGRRTVLAGGVALNRQIGEWFERLGGHRFEPLPEPDLVSALGAALNAPAVVDPSALATDDPGVSPAAGAGLPRRPPLRLERSVWPDFAVFEEYRDDQATEIRLHHDLRRQSVTGWLGIDVGSTSTKLALIDDRGRMVADLYRKTAGDPVTAIRRLFSALRRLAFERGCRLDIRGAGTTGSGRRLTGMLVGADRIANEITAHVTGALAVDPTIDTIFEIGGQDAKYIHTQDGGLRDAAMNYVCAAGTGSFVEEQARKLGIPLEEIGDRAIGVAPPVTSDRCTVFMEQDVHRLLRDGFSREEAMAAVLCSVVSNYLTKVVGNRPRSDRRIFFQGATARNKGLVAAFEQLLGIEIVVSPWCHVMGAYGVALIARDHLARTAAATTFAGLDFCDRAVDLSREECSLCQNRCEITRAVIEGSAERPSWGYLCGREPDGTTAPGPADETALFRNRARLFRFLDRPAASPRGTIGMPRALLTYGSFPYWNAFFNALGWRLRLSPPTDDRTVEEGCRACGADFCFPVKSAHGHLVELAADPELTWIFLPFSIAAPASPDTTGSYYCPYNIAAPAILRGALDRHRLAEERLLSPVVDLRLPARELAAKIHAELGPKLGCTLREVETALEAAGVAGRRFSEDHLQAGAEALARLRRKGRIGIVLLGRPYNLYDPRLNLRLPEKIASLGFPVIPFDALPDDGTPSDPLFSNLYWDLGRQIVRAAGQVARTPDLYAVSLTNFGCGPDSFVQGYVEQAMGRKPLLTLELDEHGADAGYLTRIEAFADVVSRHAGRPAPRPTAALPGPPPRDDSIAGRTLWIPPIHPFVTRLSAAVLRRAGIEARAMPLEDRASFERGLRESRGSECVPSPATLGRFLDLIDRDGADRCAYLLPTAHGPCRFGQYATLHRIVLDRLGHASVPILSWTSTDSYAGTDLATRRRLWQAIVLGDLLFKLRCRTRPYEPSPGLADMAAEEGLSALEAAFEAGRLPVGEMERTVARFESIGRTGRERPLVGIVGEIYVRCNPFCNQDLVGRIEAAGGEAWLAPMSEWIHYTAATETAAARGLGQRMRAGLKNRFLHADEQAWQRRAGRLLADRAEPPIAAVIGAGSRFVPVEFKGETILTLGRAEFFMRQGAAAVVNCAPFCCMPGTITTSLFSALENEYRVPVVSIFYDGLGDANAGMETVLANRSGSGVERQRPDRMEADGEAGRAETPP